MRKLCEWVGVLVIASICAMFGLAILEHFGVFGSETARGLAVGLVVGGMLSGSIRD